MSALVATIAQIAVLVGLVVAVAYYLKLDPMVTKVAIGVGIFAVFVVTIVNFVRRLKVPKGKVDPAKQARREAKKRLREETKVLRVRFRELVRHLRREQDGLGIRYREAADRRRWWVVLGPEGHGKSTLLSAAADSHEIAGAGAEAPRFFVSPSAVFIELPADYDRRPEAALALPSFLRDLKRLRGQPIDGVLLVQRVDGLLAEDLDITALVADARRQIDLLAKTLEVQVPVVLVGSHLDALPGLADLCADAEHVDTSRALGIALPARLTGQATAETASDRFAVSGGPGEWVRDRCFTLVASSADGYRSQARLFGFWQSFGELGKRAARVAGMLSAARLPGGDALPLRGIYFTAAGCGGASAADPSLTKMAREIGGELAGDGASAPPRVFTREFLGHELRRAGGYGRRSRPYRRRRVVTHGALAALALCVGGYAAVDMTDSARGNLELLQSTSDRAHAMPPAGARVPAEGELLRPYEALMKDVARWQVERPPEGLGWGLFRADLVKDAAVGAARASVCRGVLAPAVKAAEAELNLFVAAFAEGGVPGGLRSAEVKRQLRLFLMLTEGDEAPECRPGPDVWGKNVARDELVNTIAAKHERLQTIVESHAETVYQELRGVDPTDVVVDPCVQSLGARAARRDDDQARLVETVRDILTREEGEHALVDEIIATINDGKDSTPLHRITSSGRVHASRRQQIEYAFTKDGWSDFSRLLPRRLGGPGAGGNWALCRGSEGGAEERCGLAMEIYASRYEKEWRTFIDDISIEQPTSIAQAISVYKDLVTEAPLDKIWMAIGRNTRELAPVACLAPSKRKSGKDGAEFVRAFKAALNGDSPSEGDDATKKYGERIAQNFQGFVRFGAPAEGAGDAASETPLGKYHKRLTELRAAADQAQQSREQVGELAEALVVALRDLQTSLHNEPLEGWNQSVEGLLEPPLESLQVIVGCRFAMNLNEMWRDEVLRPLSRVAVLYPFKRKERRSAQIEDVSVLFHPVSGEIARFREAHLNSYVELVGPDVVISKSDLGARYHINPAVADLLNASNHLGLLLYPASEKAEISFDLSMGCTPKMARVELALGENEKQVLNYLCGQDQAKRVIWPGEPAANSVVLRVTGIVGTFDGHLKRGDFALLDLMERDLSPRRDMKTGKIKLSLDAQRNKLGILRMTVNPEKIQGGNIFYGFGQSKTFLAPFRSPRFSESPTSLFVEPVSCGGAAKEPAP